MFIFLLYLYWIMGKWSCNLHFNSHMSETSTPPSWIFGPARLHIFFVYSLWCCCHQRLGNKRTLPKWFECRGLHVSRHFCQLLQGLAHIAVHSGGGRISYHPSPYYFLINMTELGLMDHTTSIQNINLISSYKAHTWSLNSSA